MFLARQKKARFATVSTLFSTGFVVLYKRLNVEFGKFRGLRTESEAKQLIRKQFNYLGCDGVKRGGFMIEKIEIQDFKSIRSMSIELGKINLFLGANGAGKSNILEALGIISAATYGIVDDESLQRRGVRPGVPRLYKTSNKAFPRSPQISFSVSNRECEYKVSLLNPLDSPRPQWDYKTETFSSSGNKTPLYTKGVRSQKNNANGGMPGLMGSLEQDSPEYHFLEDLRSFAIFNPNTPMLRGIVSDPQTRVPVGLSGGGLAEGLVELFQRAKQDEELEYAIDDVIALFDWVGDINSEVNISSILSKSVARPKRVITFIDRYMKENSNKLTAYDASEGILFVLFLMVICLSESGPSIFAVDNIDQALNPKLIKKMIRNMHSWFAELVPNKQILCTAHNPAVLDGFDLTDDLIRLFMVDRNNNGLTKVSRVHITEDLVAIAKEKKISLSQLWMEGYLGGIPNV